MSDHRFFRIRYAMTIVADREIPALQWTSVRPVLAFCGNSASVESMNSYDSSKNRAMFWCHVS